LPPDPVNSFGIPQQTMRCLELAETLLKMTELFNFSDAEAPSYSPMGG
jgi:hypothetical protein